MEHDRHDVCEVEWASDGPPPAPKRLAQVLEAVAAQPGRWAISGRYPSKASAYSVASRIRRGHLGPGGDCEAEVRVDRHGEAVLYVRYKELNPERNPA